MPKQGSLSRRQKLKKGRSAESFVTNPWASSSSEEITDDEEEVIFSLDEDAMAQIPRQLQHVMRRIQADRHRQFERRASLAQILADDLKAEQSAAGHAEAEPSDGNALGSGIHENASVPGGQNERVQAQGHLQKPEHPQAAVSSAHDDSRDLSRNDHARTQGRPQKSEYPRAILLSGNSLAPRTPQHGHLSVSQKDHTRAQNQSQEPMPPRTTPSSGDALATKAHQHGGFRDLSKNSHSRVQSHCQEFKPSQAESSSGDALVTEASQQRDSRDLSHKDHAQVQTHCHEPKPSPTELPSGNASAARASQQRGSRLDHNHTRAQSHCQDPEHTQSKPSDEGILPKRIHQHASFRDLSSAERQQIAPWTAPGDDPFVDGVKNNRPAAKTGNSSGSSLNRPVYSRNDSTSTTRHRAVPALACANSPHLYRQGRLDQSPPLPAAKRLSRHLEKYFEPNDRTGPNVRLFSSAQAPNRFDDGPVTDSEARDRQSQGQWLGRFSPMPSSRRLADTHDQSWTQGQGRGELRRRASLMLTSMRTRFRIKREGMSRVFGR